MILGFDVSTSITGVTIVDDCGKIVHSEYWDLRKYKDFFDKAQEAQTRIGNLGQEYQWYDVRYKELKAEYDQAFMIAAPRQETREQVGA